MYLHAITIADIASADGKHIFAAAGKCCQCNVLRKQIICPGLEQEVPLMAWVFADHTTFFFVDMLLKAGRVHKIGGAPWQYVQLEYTWQMESIFWSYQSHLVSEREL